MSNNSIIQKIVFTENHLPTLEAGHYRIELKQQITGPKEVQGVYPATIEFAIQGERFKLNPNDISTI